MTQHLLSNHSTHVTSTLCCHPNIFHNVPRRTCWRQCCCAADDESCKPSICSNRQHHAQTSPQSPSCYSLLTVNQWTHQLNHVHPPLHSWGNIWDACLGQTRNWIFVAGLLLQNIPILMSALLQRKRKKCEFSFSLCTTYEFDNPFRDVTCYPAFSLK